VIVSAGSPADERAWLISASTCAAAALSWVVPAGADVVADAVGVPVVLAVGCVACMVPDSDPDVAAEEDAADGDAEGLGVARCAALRGGIVTTTGDAAMAISDWLPMQEPAPAVPHPAAVLPACPAACPAAGPVDSAPRVR
jgi:hypothetical protein